MGALLEREKVTSASSYPYIKWEHHPEMLTALSLISIIWSANFETQKNNNNNNNNEEEEEEEGCEVY